MKNSRKERFDDAILAKNIQGMKAIALLNNILWAINITIAHKKEICILTLQL